MNNLARGWRTLLASSLGMGFSQASLTVGTFGIFIYPLSEDFGWNRAQVSFGLTLSTLGLALATPVAGGLVDRYGSVRVMIPSSLLFGLTFVALGLQPGALALFYSLCILAAVAGAGTNAMTHTSVVARMFPARLGLALGLALAGVGVVSVLLPPLTQWMILSFDWRAAYTLLGGLCVGVTGLVALHYLRVAPATPLQAQPGARGEAPPDNSPWRALFRDRNFLVLIALFLTVSAGFTATNIHLVPILLGRGMPSQQAAMFAGLIGVGLIVGRVLAGALMDRFFAPRVAFSLFILTALGILSLSLEPSTPVLVLAAISLGFGTAAEMDLMAFLTARYFGTNHYGKIYGFFYACFMAGAAVGPLLMGIGFDSFGDYTTPLLINVVVLVIASLLTFLLGPYPAGVDPPSRVIE